MFTTASGNQWKYPTISTRTLSEEQKTKKAEYAKRYYAANKTHIIARNKAWGQRNIHLREGYVLKTRYGISVAQKAEMFEAQGCRCAVCCTETPTEKGWMVDHCHDTGRVRGVLCNHCNSMLGHARDNPETLRNAIAYLAGASAPPTI